MKRAITSLPAIGRLIVGLGTMFAASPARAAIDWSSVPGKAVVLFYPGQASWEWALTPSSMPGAADFRKGKDCAVCHIGEEQQMGSQIVTGTPRVFKTGTEPPIEPTPIPGKPGSIDSTVKFAKDGTNLYAHIEFSEGNQPNAGQDPQFATMVTLVFEGGQVPEFNRGGCFAACHNDALGMPDAGATTRTMYLPRTRSKLTAQGGDDTVLAPDKLATLKSSGYYLEYWQAKLNPGQPPQAVNGTMFDKRNQTTPTMVTAQANYAGGRWSVTLSRKLDAGPTAVRLAPGEPIHVGFAIHAGHTAHRFHYVSFERTLAINSGTADFVAVKQ